jgi:hypothetical protein
MFLFREYPKPRKVKKGVLTMSSRDQDFLPDPPRNWTRINYHPLPSTMSAAERAEKETDRDLTKSIEQLLYDFHEMAERGSLGGDMESRPTQATLHALKHMVGMMAKVALSNEAVQKSNDILQRRLYWLAIAVAILTVFSTVFGAIQATYAIVSWPK